MAKVIAADPLQFAIDRISDLLKSSDKRDRDYGQQLLKGLKASLQFDSKNTLPSPPSVNQVVAASGLEVSVLDKERIILGVANAANWSAQHRSLGSRTPGTIRSWIANDAKFIAIFGKEAYRRMATTNKKVTYKVYFTYAECLHLFEVADPNVVLKNYKLP